MNNKPLRYLWRYFWSEFFADFWWKETSQEKDERLRKLKEQDHD